MFTISTGNKKDQCKLNILEISENTFLVFQQGSVIRPQLFTVYICDLFLINNGMDFRSYADDTISFITGERHEKMISELEISAFSNQRYPY